MFFICEFIIRCTQRFRNLISEKNKPNYKKSLRACDMLNRNLTLKRESNSPAGKLDMLDNVSRLINLALIWIKHAITRETHQLKWTYHVTDIWKLPHTKKWWVETIWVNKLVSLPVLHEINKTKFNTIYNTINPAVS